MLEARLAHVVAEEEVLPGDVACDARGGQGREEGDAEPEHQGGILLPHRLAEGYDIHPEARPEEAAEVELQGAGHQSHAEGGHETPEVRRCDTLRDEGHGLAEDEDQRAQPEPVGEPSLRLGLASAARQEVAHQLRQGDRQQDHTRHE